MSSVTNITTEQFDNEIAGKEGYVLVDFYTDWCGPCKTVLPALQDVAKEYDGEVRVVKVDVEAQKPLGDRFNIAGVPTFILLKNGEIVEQFSGARPRSFFAGVIEKHLEA